MPSLLMQAAQSAAEADGLVQPIKQKSDSLVASKLPTNGTSNKNGNGMSTNGGSNKNALAIAAAQAQLVAQQRQQQQQQQQQPRKTGSGGSSKKKGQQLRRGKWTPEEEAYANRLIQEFKAGLLPLTDGTTLRTFLSKLLNCDPMRISKKFVGSNCIGKQVFRRRTADLNRLTPEQIQKSRAELSELERRFLERVAQTNRVKNSSTVGGANNNNNNNHHQNSHMHNQQLHNQHRHQQMVAAGNGVNSSHHNAVVSAALSAAVAANRGMNVNGTGNAFHRTNGNSFHHAASNPPWMQPPLGYKQGLGAQMARENLAAGQSNSRTAAAGRALLEGLGGGRSSSAKGGSDSHSHSHSHSNGSSHPASNSGMMAMAELQRRANSMQMGFGHQSAQNILAALTSGNGSSHSLAQMARNASNGSFGNIMMKSGISRDQLSQLAQNRGLSSASLSTMAIDGRKNSFDQLMSLDFQSLQSIDNLANLIQTGGGGQAAAPSSGMKNWSADVGGMNGGNAGAGRFGSTASLSNAARRLASQNNFETLMRNLSSTNNMSRTGLNHEADAYGEGNSGSNNGNANSASGSSSHSHPFGQSSTANLQSLLHSMNSGNGGSTSMSSILGGNNHSAASLANLLQRADNSATGLSALRNPDGLGGRNTTSVEDFLSLVAAGDIPHQDPAVLNLPLSQLQQQQLQQHGGNAGGSNNHNGDPRQGGNTGGNAGGNNENERSQRNHKSGQEGRHGNDHAAASILAQATGNTALANALASRSFGSNLGGSFADFSRTNLSSLGSTAELLQQLADSGGGSSSSNLKRKLLDVDGALEAQGVGKR